MTDLLLDARSVLDAGGYRTFAPQAPASCLYFEGANLLGAAYSISSVLSLFETWEGLQDDFLRLNAQRLLFDPLKAWNCYSVFLCTEQAKREQASALAMIEEDFRSTRKIVRTGVVGRLQIEESLSPLLPLRHLLNVGPDDIKSRLAVRLGGPDSPLQGLLSTTADGVIAANLIGAE